MQGKRVTNDRLEYLLRRPWRDISLPPDAVGIPTMLSKQERKLLYALARDYATDDGAVVDAGCFLGGSTAALLAGIRDRPTAWEGPPVASFDLFRVEEYTISKYFKDDRVQVGDSFRDRFDANVARFDVPHVVFEGDITRFGWSGGPIDVLFLDVLKSWEVNDAVLRDFFPSLVPGRSVIIQQDYGWGWLPWIPIGVEVMRDSLRLIDSMEWGSHVFLVERDIPAEPLEKGVSTLDLDTKLHYVDRAIERCTEPWVRGMLEIARTPLVIERDGRRAGRKDLARISKEYANYPEVLNCAWWAKKDVDNIATRGDQRNRPTHFGYRRYCAGILQRLRAMNR